MQRLTSVWISFFLATCIAPPGHSAADPPSTDKAYGPGDRPSVCYERSIRYISPNLEQMTKIAEALLAEEAVDEAGLIGLRDGGTRLHLALERIPLVRVKKTRARFRALFNGLVVNSFTPWVFFEHKEYVIARPGLYDPDVYNFNSGPWCGGTDEEWRAESERTFTAGVIWRGGPITYRYDSGGININPCSDESFISDDRGRCELQLNKHWAMVFTYINEPAPPGE